MMNTPKKIEFGDFQTPHDLSREIAVFLRDSGETPEVIVEPTCGQGSFVIAAIEAFPRAQALCAFDINHQYIEELRATLPRRNGRLTQIECKDFFQVDWDRFLKGLGKQLLVIGNPPWVTNSALGALGGANLPEKSNFQRHNGFAAKTGKANFDISEWMLIRLTEALSRRPACLAMLCKTSTARKVLRHAWVNKLNVGRCSLHLIDAQKHFAVSVDACLLITHTGVTEPTLTAPVYPGLSFNGKISTIGLAGKELVADTEEYLRLRDIEGIAYYTWRSGVKHDAASVMEFTREGRRLINGKHEECDLESTYLFPLLKSSDIANGRTTPDKLVLITQKKPSDDTLTIATVAPKTWDYLTRHAETLDKRKSIIYEKRARFSVFGVGDYTFAPWKVAISGLYKTCRFEVVGQFRGKPTALDDTCYFIPCKSEDEARFMCELLNSDICQRFLRSLVFFDSKRPIKIDILNRIDLMRIAEKLDKGDHAQEYLTHAGAFEHRQPQLVFEGSATYRTTTSKRRRKPHAVSQEELQKKG